jgi:FlaG/FlaF family flagellin (archaellin)
VSPVVGVVLLVGLTVVLAGVAGTLLAFSEALVRPPQVSFTVTADATDGWPDGQRVRVAHRGGDPLDVTRVTVVVGLPRVEAQARISDFPTRRLTPEHVRGDHVFDRGYAGVEGVLDAAHTDGTWAAGESTSVRVAQHEHDLRPGDRVRVRVVHQPSNAVLVRSTVRADRS